MMEISFTVYTWIKAFHIISVISWMAGLLYLPRLFVYHVDARPQSSLCKALKIMERRLLRIIMTPAMVATWVSGLILFLHLYAVEISESGSWEIWIYVKGLSVVSLTVLHGKMASWQRAFAEDRNIKSERFFRILNEVPTLLMIIIVIMVIIRF